MRAFLCRSRMNHRIRKSYDFDQIRMFSSKISDREDALSFVLARGYKRSVATGVVDALESSCGRGSGQIFDMVKRMAGRWEVGEDAGLADLAAAVEADLLRREGKSEVTIKVSTPSGTKFDVKGLEGQSLYDIVQAGNASGADVLREYIECACSGVMACSTCQVVVAPEWFPKVGEPCEAELDMLDLAFEPQDTSRLGCQLVLSKTLNGLEISIPNGANNLMDSIPFQDKKR